MLTILNINDLFFERRNLGCQSKFLEGQNLSYFLHKLEQSGKRRILNYQIKPTISVIVKIYSLDELQFSVGVNALTVVGDLQNRLTEILGIHFINDMEIFLQANELYFLIDRDEIIGDLKENIVKKNSLSFFTNDIFQNKLSYVLKKTIFLPLKYEINEYI